MYNRFLVALVLLGLLFPAAAQVEAQELAVRFYFVPVDVRIIEGREYRGPSYIKWRFNPDGLDVSAAGWRYYAGMGEGLMFLWAEVDQAQHDFLAAQAGVFVIPENPDSTPSPAELSALETYLEAGYTPADWLSPSDSWRANVRTAVHMWSLAAKYTVLTGNAPQDDPELSFTAQFRNLSQRVQDAIRQAYTELGFDDSVIRDNWTLRIIMKNSADQRGDVPLVMGAQEF